MVNTNTNSAVQLSLFPSKGSSVKDSKKGRPVSDQVINAYLSTREGLWRLLACFPANMPVREAVSLARTQVTLFRKEVAV